MAEVKSKELDWQEYEAVTKYIYENLGAADGIKIKGYGRNFRVKGKTGEKYQVDDPVYLCRQPVGDKNKDDDEFA